MLCLLSSAPQVNAPRVDAAVPLKILHICVLLPTAQRDAAVRGGGRAFRPHPYGNRLIFILAVLTLLITSFVLWTQALFQEPAWI